MCLLIYSTHQDRGRSVLSNRGFKMCLLSLPLLALLIWSSFTAFMWNDVLYFDEIVSWHLFFYLETPAIKSPESVIPQEVHAESVTPRDLPPEELSKDPVLKHNSYVVNNFINDTLKNLKMSIRRKRVCSSSSVMSTNDSVPEDGRNQRRRKKRKRKQYSLCLCNILRFKK